MKKSTRAWVKKAEDDYLIAIQAHKSKAPVYDGVCFHCQQCAEKYFKGLKSADWRFRRSMTWKCC